MNTTQAQQKALNDALVGPTDRLEFGKYNMRLKTDIKPKEATFQVVLDALALTPFYKAFLITVEDPAIYMQEFWAIISVHRKNIDYVYLLWEDFLFQVENKDAKKTNKMSYPKFTKIIINHFMSNDQSISRRNKMFWHTARDDTIKLISNTSQKKKPVQATEGTRLKSKAKVAKFDKKKQPSKMPKAKGLNVLSEVALTESEQIKLATKRSKTQFHSSHASGSGDGVDTQSKNESWGFSDEEDDDDEHDFEDDADDNDDEHDFEDDADDNDDEHDFEDDADDNDDDGDDNDDDGDDNNDNDDDDDKNEDDEESDSERTESDSIKIPVLDQSGTEHHQEEEDDSERELYRDLNVNLRIKDVDMSDAVQGGAEQLNKTTEPMHSSSVSSEITNKLLNFDKPPPADNVISSLIDTAVTSTRTVPPPPPFFNPLQHEATPTPTTTTSPTMTLLEIPDFASLFRFDQRVSTLEAKMSEFNQTSQFAKVVSSISGIVDMYFAPKMKEAVDVAVQLQTNKLREEA
ncbi:hypothetical protein Tco_1065669 [Tanacetum coccineum]